MIKIEKATVENTSELTELAKETFIQSHGHCASKQDVDNYIHLNFTTAIFKRELERPENEYYLLFYKNQIVGYSKIIFHQFTDSVEAKNVAKLERIYLLEVVHGLGLGEHLLNFNGDLAKKNQQAGMWLHTWVENKRAVRFYEKMGFKIVGSYDFKISETHSNPNHRMYKEF